MTSKVDPPTDNRPRADRREHVSAGRIALSVAWCTVGDRSEPAELEGASAMTVSVEPTSVEPKQGEPDEALRPHAEDAFAGELAALAAQDDRPRPVRWKLSPWAVATYLLGGTLPDGTVITPKYVGPRRLVEVAVTTLATDRALLLLGVPGTAKTWVSEHLAAAVSGDSKLLVPGTAGTAQGGIAAAGAGHRRQGGGGYPVGVKLPPPARRGAERGGDGGEPDHAGHADRHDRP